NLVQDEAVLPADLIEMARWMRSYYAAPLEGILERMIPGPVRRGMKMKLESYLVPGRKLSPDELEELARRAPRQAALYRFVAEQLIPQKKSVLLERLQIGAATCKALVDKGLLIE